MTFVLFKIAGVLLRPGTILVLALLLGTALWSFGGRFWRRAGQALAIAATAFAAALLVLPLGSIITAPLETAVAPAELPDRIVGVVILGGAAHAPLSDRHGTASVNEAGERIFAGLALARRYPEARIVYSGGNAQVVGEGAREADVARTLFAELGFSGLRFVYEGASRNTFENARETKALVGPKAGEAWVLVTSAAHMPRALGVFAAAGWPMLAHPVDYRSGGSSDPVVDMNFSEELQLFEYGFREWLGRAAYRLRGWTSP